MDKEKMLRRIYHRLCDIKEHESKADIPDSDYLNNLEEEICYIENEVNNA